MFLPKWKGPGVKWRLVINKHRAPATGLDHMPQDHWSDFPSANVFLDMVAEFNEQIRNMFAAPCGWIWAMDRVDCFHHLPCSEAPLIWDRVGVDCTACFRD